MEITPKGEENFSLPLPIFTSIHIAEAKSREGEDFAIHIGLDKEMTVELEKLSLDESDVDLMQNTSDRKRFGLGSYEEWYGKNRTPFALIHKRTGKLAALVWFGPKELKADGNNWQAVGWRSYNPFRGKGIMKGFTKYVMGVYEKNMPPIKFWAALKRGNEGSYSLSLALGFQVLEEECDRESIVMIK